MITFTFSEENMENEKSGMKTLEFQSPGDLKSAQRFADEKGIFFTILNQDKKMVKVSSEDVLKFLGLGSINFGIKIGTC